jgi:hypothetical protein
LPLPVKFQTPRTIDQIRKPAERATLAIASWSDACGIQWKQSQSGSDLLLMDTLGRPHDLVIEPTATETATFTNPVLRAVASDMTSDERDVAFGAFHKLTDALGYGKPIPVDRGAEPDKKLCYKDEMELVALCHNLLRMSPNLAPEKIAPYAQVIDNCTRFYANKFKRFFDLFGYKQSDLATYSYMWFLIWHHHYRKLFAPVVENKKLLTRYIQQRFINFGGTVQSKADGCFPEGESVTVAFYEESLGKPPVKRAATSTREGATGPVLPFATEHEYNKPVDAADDEEYQRTHNLLDKRSETKRRKSAAAMLADLLSQLPHDRLVSVLTETEANGSFEYDARMEARRQLRKHQESCSVCKENKNVA